MTTLLQDQGFAIAAAGGIFTLVFVLTLILGALLRPAVESGGQRLLGWLRGLTSDFEKRYRAHLLDEYRVMNVRGRKTKSPVSLELERVYVSLQTQLPESRAERGRLESLSVAQALARSQRLVIIGQPGSGKTTLLTYLLLTYARGLTGQRLNLAEQRLPIFVPLRQLKSVLQPGQAGSLAAYLTQTYEQLGLAPPPAFFEDQLKHGRCLVLLDGLDEVADQTERVKLSEWVDRQVTIYPDNRYVVSSRPAGYDTAALENGFLRLDVQDFSQSDIEQFCRNWCLSIEIASQGEESEAVRRRAEQAAADLIGAIGQNPAVRGLALNPLLLSIIALVHRYRATLPRRRVELYAECVDVLLGKWDEAKGLAARLTESQKRAVLQPLALYMHQHNTRELDGPTLRAQLKIHLPAVGGTPQEADDFLKEVRDRSGLLLEQGLNSYTFSHLTFQEYLVARELADNGPEELLRQQAGEEWWREVTLLYTGLKDATTMVQALLAAGEQDGPDPLLLAGSCLIDAQKIDPAVKTETLQRLEALFNNGAGQPFLQAGHLLAEIEGEQAVTRFLKVAAGENEARRNAAMWALEQMLTDQNEPLRQSYQTQLLAAAFDPASPYLRPAALVLAGLAERDETVAVAVEKRLARIVPDKITVLSQTIVTLLNNEVLGDIATGWLDSLMAEIPNLSIRVARYPVTNAQYRRFVTIGGYITKRWWSEDGWQWVQQTGKYQPDFWNDPKWNGPDYPVVGVSWYEAEAYGNWLSEASGRPYRLPTEVEWQRAAQGNDKRVYPWGDDWVDGRCNTSEAGIGYTTPVGQFSPAGDSPVGCADMSGNVWEWCQDGDGGGRVLRGGSWIYYQHEARCAYRNWYDPYISSDDLGFRLVFPS